jgi:tetratricopeptide (TPR) repeat protein
MILRIVATLFLVCGWCGAQATQGSEELDRRLRLVDVERSRGRLESAESMLAEAHAAIERTEGPGLRLAMALRERGLLRDDEARPEEAIAFYERALAMVRAKPDADPIMRALLIANLSCSHADFGHADLAVSLSAEALTLLQGAAERTSPAFASALYAHGVALHRLGRNAEALQELREALDIWGQAADSAYVALAKEAMADCFSGLGYNNLAEAAVREALAIRGNVGAPDSLGIGAAMNNLGVILAREQKWSEGQQALERATAIFEQFGASEERRLTTALGNLGALYYQQARTSTPFYAKAEEIYRRKLAIEERMFGPSDLRISPTLEMLGEVLYRERAYDEARHFYSRGLAIQTSTFGSSDPKTRAAAKRYDIRAKKTKAGAVR